MQLQLDESNNATYFEGIPKRGEFKIPKSEWPKIVARYRDDKQSCPKIAGKYDVAESTIRYLLKRLGVKLRSAKEASARKNSSIIPKSEWPRIASSYRDDKRSQKKLAKQYGVSQNVIQAILKRLGIRSRMNSEGLNFHYKQLRESGQVVSNAIFSQKEERHIAHLYRDENQSVRDIAKKLGVSDICIYRVLKRQNCKCRGKEVLTYSQKLKIRLLYENGISSPELAKEFDVPVSTICYWLCKAGVKARKSNILEPSHERDIIARYQRGEKPADIARAYGISKCLLVEIVKRHGIPRDGSLRRSQQFAEARAYHQTLFKAGFSTRAIAELTNTPHSTITKYIHGRR